MRVIVSESGITVQTRENDMPYIRPDKTDGEDLWSCRMAAHEGVTWAIQKLSEELQKSIQFYRTGEPKDNISIEDAPYYGPDGGRESVDDALVVVASFGPGIQGVNDDFARQIILADEVRRLRSLVNQGGQKYDDVLFSFQHLMRHELHANAHKGDRPGWLAMNPQTCLLDIHYHVAKLQKASFDGNVDGVREHAADVANMAMMLLDIHGGLEYDITDWPEGIQIIESKWIRNDEAVLCSTLLISDHYFNGPITPERISTWTDEECKAVQDYCVAIHVSASDNDDYPVPEKPAVLDQEFSKANV